MLRRQLKNLVQNYSEAEVKVGILPGVSEKNASFIALMLLVFGPFFPSLLHHNMGHT